MTQKELFKMAFEGQLRYLVPRGLPKKQTLYIAKATLKIMSFLDQNSYREFTKWIYTATDESFVISLNKHLFFSSRKNYTLPFLVAQNIVRSFEKRGFNSLER